MGSERNFRTEAHATRKAARETLIALREARRRKLKLEEISTSSPEKSSLHPAALAPETLFDMTAGVNERDRPEADMAEDDNMTFHDLEESHDAEALEEDAARSSEREESPEARERSNRSSDGAAPPEMPSTPPQEAENTVPPRGSSEDGGFVASDSELFQLPGAGAGIVWMFQQCGVHALSDLAQADARQLSEQLGVVGHILNIQPWIDFAREAGR